MPIDPHRLAEERSLAAHRLIASRMADEPHLLEMARTRVEGWLADGSVARPYAEAWQAILAAELDAITTALTDPSERGRARASAAAVHAVRGGHRSTHTLAHLGAGPCTIRSECRTLFEES